MQNTKLSFGGIRDYIISHELTDSVAIVLHPQSFDMVALDYIKSHGTIERPFEIIGIEIREDIDGHTSRNSIKTVNNL